MWRHAPRINSIGIHQVAVAQKNSVKPFKKGISWLRMVEPSAAESNVAPAKVEIAIAPMLIQ